MATMKEFMEYQGTETEPFILDKPIDIFSDAIDHKTPFGVRWGGETIILKMKHLNAMIEGKYIAIDVEHEYIAFLTLDFEEDLKDGFFVINSEQHNRRIRELVDEMIIGNDVGNLSIALDQMADTLIAINNEMTRLKRSQRHHIAKAEKWEARARALYRELHGKDAPPQG